MYEESWLTSFEKQIVRFLERDMFDPKAKDFFLADLSWGNGWVGNDLLSGINPIHLEDRMQITVRFFTHRHGKKYFDQLPEDIKNKILANSL